MRRRSSPSSACGRPGFASSRCPCTCASARAASRSSGADGRFELVLTVAGTLAPLRRLAAPASGDAERDASRRGARILDRERADDLHPVCAARLARAEEEIEPDDAVLLSGWARGGTLGRRPSSWLAPGRGALGRSSSTAAARSTYGNAVGAAAAARGLARDEVVLVTSGWHGRRLRLSCELRCSGPARERHARGDRRARRRARRASRARVLAARAGPGRSRRADALACWHEVTLASRRRRRARPRRRGLWRRRRSPTASATDEWAEGFCAAITTWHDSLENATDELPAAPRRSRRRARAGRERHPDCDGDSRRRPARDSARPRHGVGRGGEAGGRRLRRPRSRARSRISRAPSRAYPG